MRREIIPSSINTGDVLLVSGNNLLQQTIQQFEKCKWNHAAMFVWVNNILYVVEASMRGIALTPFSHYDDQKDIGLLVMRPDFEVSEREYINFMLPYAGHTDYGFMNLFFYQAIRYLTKKKIWIGPKLDPKTHHFICGEWVAFVYNHFNPELFPDWNRLAPEDLFHAPCFDKLVYK